MEENDAKTRMVWKNSDKSAALCILMSNNAKGLTMDEIQSEFIDTYGGYATYSPRQDSWCAVSVNDDTFYHYAYYRTDGKRVKGFEFHFSGAENLAVYSKYIDHIYSSFKDV